MRKIFIFFLFAVSALLFLIGWGVFNSIEYYPSCFTFYSKNQNYTKGEWYVFDLLHAKLNLNATPLNGALKEYFSGNTTVKWSEGTNLWVNVCQKKQGTYDWVVVSEKVQEILAKDNRIYVRVNFDSRNNKCKHDVNAEYPVDTRISKILDDSCK